MELWAALLSGLFGLLTASSVLWLTQREDRKKRQEDAVRRREEREADESRLAADREAIERRWHADRDREEARRQSEEARWYGQPFLQRRFDALAALHAVLAEIRFSLVPHGGLPQAGWMRDQIEQHYLALSAKGIEFMRTVELAGPYLENEPARQAVNTALNTYFEVYTAILGRLGVKLESMEPGRPEFFQIVESTELARVLLTREAALHSLTDLLTPILPRGGRDEPAHADTDTQ